MIRPTGTAAMASARSTVGTSGGTRPGCRSARTSATPTMIATLANSEGWTREAGRQPDPRLRAVDGAAHRGEHQDQPGQAGRVEHRGVAADRPVTQARHRRTEQQAQARFITCRAADAPGHGQRPSAAPRWPTRSAPRPAATGWLRGARTPVPLAQPRRAGPGSQQAARAQARHRAGGLRATPPAPIVGNPVATSPPTRTLRLGSAVPVAHAEQGVVDPLDTGPGGPRPGAALGHMITTAYRGSSAGAKDANHEVDCRP